MPASSSVSRATRSKARKRCHPQPAQRFACPSRPGHSVIRPERGFCAFAAPESVWNVARARSRRYGVGMNGSTPDPDGSKAPRQRSEGEKLLIAVWSIVACFLCLASVVRDDPKTTAPRPAPPQSEASRPRTPKPKTAKPKDGPSPAGHFSIRERGRPYQGVIVVKNLTDQREVVDEVFIHFDDGFVYSRTPAARQWRGQRPGDPPPSLHVLEARGKGGKVVDGYSSGTDTWNFGVGAFLSSEGDSPHWTSLPYRSRPVSHIRQVRFVLRSGQQWTWRGCIPPP
jgi:hypothetical protein